MRYCNAVRMTCWAAIAASAIGLCVIGAVLDVSAQAPVIGQGGGTTSPAIYARGAHAHTGGKQPTVVTCGSAPAGLVVNGSTDTMGRFVAGGGATSCTLLFATAYAVPPFCVVTEELGAATYAAGSTGIFVNVTGGNAVNWFCTDPSQ